MADKNDSGLTPEEKKRQEDFAKWLKKSGLSLKDWDDRLVTSEELMEEAVDKLVGTIGGTVVKGFTRVATTALNSGDAFQSATALMKTQLEFLGDSIKVGADSLVKAGEQMARNGDKSGQKLAVLGQAVGVAVGAITQLAESGMDFLLKQVDTSIKSFQTLSQSGAVLSGSMSDLMTMSSNAGLTLEQFSGVVKANTANFAQMGMGVTEGTKRLASVMSDGPGAKKLKDGMYALGMSAEEQGDAVAHTMALMAGPSGQLKASNAEVQATTREYAANLKLISDITGQDAKAREEKLRQENDTLAFNSYLNGLDEKERFRTIEAMKLMSAEDQRAFREKQIYGTVVSQDLNIARATNDGIRKAQDEQFAAAQQHNLNIQTVADAYERNSKEALEANNKLGKSIGLATQGPAAEAAKALNSAGQYMAKFGNASKRAAAIQEQQNKGTQPGTAGDMMAQQQDFAIGLQQIAQEQLPAFSDALKSYANNVKGALSVFAGGGSALMSIFSGWGSVIASVIAPVIGIALSQYAAGKLGKGVAAKGVEALGEKALGGGMSALGKGAEELGGGVSKGAKISLFLTELAEGLTALTPAIPVILTLTAAVVGLGFGLKLAAPAFESIGKAVTLIVGGVADALIKMATEVNPLKLLAIAPGIAAIGIAMLPFGVGGALAGIVGGTGGFDAVVAGIQKFEQLSPEKLTAVAGAMKKINESLPTAADLAKMAVVSGLDHLLGGGSTSKTGGAGETDTAKLMTEIVTQQKQMVAYLKENVDYSKKLLHVSS